MKATQVVISFIPMPFPLSLVYTFPKESPSSRKQTVAPPSQQTHVHAKTIKHASVHVIAHTHHQRDTDQMDQRFEGSSGDGPWIVPPGSSAGKWTVEGQSVHAVQGRDGHTPHDRHTLAFGTMDEAWNAEQKQDDEVEVMDEDEWIEGEEEGGWDEEEEWDDDDEEEDSEDDMRPKRAFEVVGEPDEDSGPPVDGEEYLRRVIAEAKRYPDVITSDVDPRSFDHRRTEYVPKSKAELDTDEKQLHEEGILCEIMEDFAKLRLHVASMKQNTGREDEEINQHTWQDNWEQLLEGEPEAKKLSTLDQHSLGSLFLELARRANNQRQLSNHDSLWMYYILAFLEKPLEKQAEMAIKHLQEQSTRLQSQSSDTSASTPNLNMIKHIAEETFA